MPHLPYKISFFCTPKYHLSTHHNLIVVPYTKSHLQYLHSKISPFNTSQSHHSTFYNLTFQHFTISLFYVLQSHISTLHNLIFLHSKISYFYPRQNTCSCLPQADWEARSWNGPRFDPSWMLTRPNSIIQNKILTCFCLVFLNIFFSPIYWYCRWRATVVILSTFLFSKIFLFYLCKWGGNIFLFNGLNFPDSFQYPFRLKLKWEWEKNWHFHTETHC